jgi:hypothetical protein
MSRPYQQKQTALQEVVGKDCAWLVNQYLQPVGPPIDRYVQFECVLADILRRKLVDPSQQVAHTVSCLMCILKIWNPVHYERTVSELEETLTRVHRRERERMKIWICIKPLCCCFSV